MKKLLPVYCIFKDKVIDVMGDSVLEVPSIYVRKGRTLTIKNICPNKAFILKVKGNFTNKKGATINLLKVPEKTEKGECNCDCHFIDFKNCWCNCNK